MTVIIDYGVGNLFSLLSSLEAVGAEATVTSSPELIAASDRMILPGVGAFGDAAAKLGVTGLGEVVKEQAAKGKPVLGICLGMQLLFEQSYEFGEHKGLGLIPGSVVPVSGLVPRGYKIPHIGWNALRIRRQSPILKYVKDGDCVYFVHSYAAVGCDGYVTADTEYGVYLTAAVGDGCVYGCQFHPEKSGDTGLSILKAFTEL